MAEKDLSIRYVPGPLGVRGRNSHNALIREKLGWAPSGTLLDGLKQTYPWIAHQVNLVGGDAMHHSPSFKLDIKLRLVAR